MCFMRDRHVLYHIIMCLWIKGVGEGRGGGEVAVFQSWCDAGLDNALFHYQIGT